MPPSPLFALAFLALAAGCLAPPPGAPADAAPAEEDSLACVATPCEARPFPFGAEPWVAIDPADPLHAVAGAMTFWAGPGVGHPWTSVASTFDGGLTWEVTQPTGSVNEAAPPVGPYNFAADVMLAFAKDGSVVLATLAGRAAPGFYCASPAGVCGPPVSPGSVNALELVAWRSTDGGRSFGEAVVVADAEGAATFSGAVPLPFPNRAAGAYHDREHLAADPVTGRLHLVWSRISGAEGFDVVQSVSDDGGATWTPYATVVADGYGPFVVAYDGVVLLTARVTGAESGYVMLRSEDGGATWSEPARIVDVPYYTTVTAALWRDGAGALAAVRAYPEGESQERVLVQASRDGGLTWGAPVLALPEAPTAKRLPTLAVDPASGRGALFAYEGAPDDPAVLAPRVVPIVDGVPLAAAALALNASASERAAFDYASAAASSAGALVAWGADAEGGAIEIVAAPLAWVRDDGANA